MATIQNIIVEESITPLSVILVEPAGGAVKDIYVEAIPISEGVEITSQSEEIAVTVEGENPAANISLSYVVENRTLVLQVNNGDQTVLVNVITGAISVTNVSLQDILDLLDDYEPYLGKPAASDYILASDTEGHRSWVPRYTHPDLAQTTKEFAEGEELYRLHLNSAGHVTGVTTRVRIPDAVVNLGPLENITGNQTFDVTDYVEYYRVLDITVALKQGTAGYIKAGLTLDGDDVLMPTDLSYLTVGDMVSIYCGKIFPPDQEFVFLNMDGTGEQYDIYMTLIRYKGA